AERAQQRLRQAERAEHVRGQCQLELLTLRIGQERQRRRSEARGVVDEHVETAEIPHDLQRDRIDVLLPCDVASDAVCGRMRTDDRFDMLAGPCDERYARAAAEQFA